MYNSLLWLYIITPIIMNILCLHLFLYRYDAINGLPAVQQSVTFEKVSFFLKYSLDHSLSLTLYHCIMM